MKALLHLLAVAAIVGLLAAGAYAVCGDANGDGNVSVTDGVQVLRAAADLSSNCGGNDDCDVDGSGSITVTDGVNVLRKAAGLSSVDNCPNNPVSSLIGHTIDIFGPITKVGAVGGASAAGSISPCDNASGGFQQTSDGFVFDDCQIGSVSFTGFLGTADGNLNFSNLAVRRAGDVLTLQGSLSVGDSGGNPALNGVLNGDSVLLGSYVTFYQQVVTDSQGNTLGGTLVFDTSEANIPDVVEVRVGLNGSTTLPVVVRYTDDSTANFTYNTDTDSLTPVTGPTPTPTPPAAQVRLFNIDDTITAFVNGQQVLQASSTGPNATQDTGFRTVTGLTCGDNRFDFVVNNVNGGGGYTYGVQLRIDGALVVNSTCGTAGSPSQGCNGNDTAGGEVVRDETFFCVPCGPCSAAVAGTCASPGVLPGSGRATVHARTAGSSNFSGQCGANGGGPESVFRFTPSIGGCYAISNCGTAFNSLLAIGDGFCPGTSGPIEESCYDDISSCPNDSTGETVHQIFQAGQPATIVLDGFGAADAGSYTLDVRPSSQCLF
jgi:hypothetical protein